MSSSKKIIIAHRGACGYLPEHTLPAYALAYGLGADYLEPDLVMTRDGVLIIRHDIFLEQTTDVAVRFPERRCADGHWYVADFDLDEIKRLQARERLPARYPRAGTGFQVATLEELLQMLQSLNRTSQRQVGVYPETKAPAWHRARGLALEEPLLILLERYGCGTPQLPVFIQSFEVQNLRQLRTELGTQLPLVQLLEANAVYAPMLTAQGLAMIAEYANAIGPDKRVLEDDQGRPTGGRALVDAAHARGLAVHPYTFRRDQLPAAYDSFSAEVARYYFEYGVDGLFTDHTDTAVQVLGRQTEPFHAEER